ncbi:MAG TPA: hypothetical protein VMB35_03485 [Methanomicrobiales archaeon]|nr:hypothetical protein [Methanomicrobiales archaeon]
MKGNEKGKHVRKGSLPAGDIGTLKDRYRTTLVDRLTRADLGELQSYLGKMFDGAGNLDREYREKFEWKLRQYLPEEVLTRETPGIEALVRSLRPGDLKR